jgi:hypothetical protein
MRKEIFIYRLYKNNRRGLERGYIPKDQSSWEAKFEKDKYRDCSTC